MNGNEPTCEDFPAGALVEVTDDPRGLDICGKLGVVGPRASVTDLVRVIFKPDSLDFVWCFPWELRLLDAIEALAHV